MQYVDILYIKDYQRVWKMLDILQNFFYVVKQIMVFTRLIFSKLKITQRYYVGTLPTVLHTDR